MKIRGKGDNKITGKEMAQSIKLATIRIMHTGPYIRYVAA